MTKKQPPRLGENKMGTMPVGKLLFTMALPLALSMLVQAFYNIVDTYFVSLLDADATGALSLAFPVQNLQIGCATGVAVGMNSLLSKSLGEHNRDRANQAAGNGIFLTFLMIGIFMLFGFLFTESYYSLFDTNATTRQYGIDYTSISAETAKAGTAYTSICCIFTAGIFVEILGERLLQASGRTIYTLFTQGTGAVLNIILDPLFILGSAGLKDVLGIELPFYFPAFGVAGAAIATVIGQWVAGILAIIFNFTSNPDVSFKLKYLRPDKAVIGKILAVGVPSMIMMAIGSVMNFCMNQIFLGFRAVYGQTPANVFGIYFKIQSIFLMPLFGINNASISIIAYNYGARLPKRITHTVKLGVASALVIMLAGFGIFQLFPDTLMGIFGSSGGADAAALVEIGATAIRIVSFHFPLAAIGIGLVSSFQGLGNGIYSSITSLCRQLVALVPAAYLLSLTGSVDAVWWAFPIAEVVSTVLSVLFFLRIYRRKIKPLFAA